MLKILILLFSFWFVPSFALEDDAYLKSLKGHFTQGGFISGEAVPFSKVKFAEYETVADEKGIFYIGIPRLAGKNEILEVTVLGQDSYKIPLKIKQNEYKAQYIKGVKDKHVTPRSDEDWARIKKDAALINQARQKEFLPLRYIEGEFLKPVKGPITGVFGSRRFYNGEERSWHKGHDFAATTGTPIQAPEGGVVKLALENSYFNGNLVIVEHGYGMMTLYAHLNSISVKEGDHVKKGQIIGTVGSTGRSTGPHLHWGLYWGKMALNPMLLFEKQQILK